MENESSKPRSEKPPSETSEHGKFSGRDRKNLIRAVGVVTQLGFTMALCVLGGVLLGVFLDSRLGTSPWLTLVLSGIGCLAAFKAMFDIAKKI